ncbi:MAG: glycine dehydrogenase (aminomethyl-transferring) [Denitrovibrio sp.]|nr:MAG: glycine dehydrogenase (aminomethyl-transferring) [Denitrovibrio sp.]
MSKMLFEKSVEGRKGVSLPAMDVPAVDMPANLKRNKLAEIGEYSELDVVRHYTNLSLKNFSVDTHFYPLGSCTMKYNPKVCETVARFDGLAAIHPMMPVSGGLDMCQGALELIYELENHLSEVTGMSATTLQPLAGAHGEMLGIMLIASYHRAKGNKKKYVIVPDSSHGTNPATASMMGYEIITVKTADYGDMDLDEFKEKMNDEVAAVMMTNPNTLGVFNPYIKEISEVAHAHDAMLYYDGANLNAILGKVRPGDLGFDVVHVNLHKTYATPHGSGGPGAGPVGCSAKLEPFLPQPRVVKTGDKFSLNYDKENPRITSYFGNYGVLVKAYTYALMMGSDGLKDVAEKAVLNANYIMQKLKPYYDLPYDKTCMHECVFSASRQVEKGVHALDIAKGLIDRGFHPPTVYFPLIVPEAMMIEPTETESKQTMDEFIDAMIEIAGIVDTDPDSLHHAPVTRPVTRLDETQAARQVNVRYQKDA